MLINILIDVVLPLFLLIGAGFLLDRRLNLDVQTISRINFYILSPAIIFSLTYNSTLNLQEIAGIGVFAWLHLAVIFAIAFAVFTLPIFRPHRAALSLGASFHNAGYYGIPVMVLAYGNDAVSVLGVILVAQAIVFFTLGLMFLVGARETSLKDSLLQVLKYPVLYGLVLGLLMRGLNIGLPAPINTTLTYMTNCFVGLALINIGVQLSKCPFMGDLGSVSVVGLIRFAISPIIAATLVPLFHFTERLSTILIVQAALPVALNVYFAASEVERDADLVSRMIFWTTLASVIALPIIMLIVGQT